MCARRNRPGTAASLRLELELDDLRVEPSSADEVKVTVGAGSVRATLSLTGDAAIDLANQLTDAVDRLDGKDQA